MSKIYFQGTYGAYSHLAALSVDPNAEIIPCKTFDECFINASKDVNAKIIIPESNRITGNIGIEYLIFEYRLNIYSEYFQKIEHNLLGLPGVKISEIKDVYSHGQALSQCSNFIKSNNLIEHVRADTAGSAGGEHRCASAGPALPWLWPLSPRRYGDEHQDRYRSNEPALLNLVQ